MNIGGTFTNRLHISGVVNFLCDNGMWVWLLSASLPKAISLGHLQFGASKTKNPSALPWRLCITAWSKKHKIIVLWK